MEVWNPMLWEFSRVMRECHRKIGAMLGKDKPPVGQAPIMGLLRTQDGLTQEEVSERLQRNETSVALAVERLVQEGYLTFEGEALHLTDAGQAEGARTARAMEETDFDVAQLDELYAALEQRGVHLAEEPAELPVLDDAQIGRLENELSSEGVALDDPVKTYLKEIGRVPLVAGRTMMPKVSSALAGLKLELKDECPAVRRDQGSE